MRSIDYISNDIKPLKLDDNIDKIKKIFSNYYLNYLPIVDNNIFYGTIAKQDIDYSEYNKLPLSKFKEHFKSFHVYENEIWFEVLQNFATYNTKFLPVLDSKNTYIGYYELDDFLNIFKCTPFLHEEGMILVISKNINDYSFSEISQIVESNGAKLYGVFISKFENETIQITLKLSLHDINDTLQSFRRYNYDILNDIGKDTYLEELNNRSEYLQKYLNI